MAFPKKAEQIEENPRLRRPIATICTGVGLAGLLLSVHQRHQSTLQMDRLVGNVSALVANTNTLVVSTNSVSAITNLMLPQVVAANSSLADLRAERRNAESNKNPRLAAKLQSKIDEIQKRADDSSRQIAIALLPKLAEQLRSANGWVGNEWQVIRAHHDGPTMLMTNEQRQADETAIQSEWASARAIFNAKLRAVFSIEPYLIDTALRGASITEQDAKERALLDAYISGRQLPSELDADRNADYLDSIVKRSIP